ncbi:cytochrome P450 2J6-like [Patiria miniata]|uniref:Cytochrome P450 n=1 Tax=Patiria miniata TaxID=46514 RepID=A0A914AJS1_PATMI|nr:cytochrome P450 2J6-like [Patiria miniata]
MTLSNFFLDVRTVLLGLFILLVLRWFFKKPIRNLPPGPWRFPILGSAPAIVSAVWRGLEPHDLFVAYAAKYGPVFRLKAFTKTVIVLSDYPSIKEAFQHPELSDRPNTLISAVTKTNGVVSASGELMIELRRFCLTVLRSFGVGKTSFEEKIGTEAEELMKEMSSFDGKPFNPKRLLSNAVSNVICSVIFGKRYEYTDQKFQNLLDLISRNIKLLGAGGVFFFIPGLRYLPFGKFKQMISNIQESEKFVVDIIEAHRAEFDPENLKDFVDVYLKESQQNLNNEPGAPTSKSSSSAARSHLNDSNFVGTIRNLFIAGSETTATTLQWCLLYMMMFPEIQHRVQAEIDAVVGRNRLPRMADKRDLNFTQAVIWEVQRLACIAPLGIPHTAASDTHIHGFTIPKGAILVPNLWALFRDPRVYPEPDRFNPERFLDSAGKAVKPDELVPFSVGRRSCIGEHLAKMELLIFFSYFLHQFTFKKPDNSPPLSLKGKGGITYSPEPFELCAVKRE